MASRKSTSRGTKDRYNPNIEFMGLTGGQVNVRLCESINSSRNSFGSGAVTCLLARPTAHFEFYLDWFFVLHLLLGICTSASLVLPLLALATPILYERKSPWLLNTKDLLAGETERNTRLTWLGVKRNPESYVFSTSATVYGAQAAKRIVLSFLRRVSPVETRKYALLRNVAALLAILVLAIRAITLLAQAQGEVFQTINRLEPCSWSDVSRSEVQIIVAHSSLRSTLLLPGLGYSMNITVSERAHSSSGGYHWKNAGVCSPKPLTIPARDIQTRSRADGTSSLDDVFDVFDVFTCDTTQNDTLLDARYDINIRANGSSSLDGVALPQIWLNVGTPDELLPQNNISYMHALTPWLVPSWQLTAGVHSVAEVNMAKRNFIKSPFLRDTLGGMKPEYQSIALLPITTVRETPLNMSVASGTIAPSTRIQFSSSSTYQNIKKLRSDSGSLPQICEVVEDYRASTAFDAIGSIGGLLAILQGLHILLFGRPMFWGIFGAKLLTPFGLLGGCSSAGFRRRLRGHYYANTDSCERGESTNSEMIRLHAFLRDYVIDFGPADSSLEEKDTALI
ncbi:hypothetical protein FRC07_001462 [Ceratobasidium sp. 392]|nr:hypothetical protein FRC07_001462 [Ceratobasidium sp. 392]